MRNPWRYRCALDPEKSGTKSGKVYTSDQESSRACSQTPWRVRLEKLNRGLARRLDDLKSCKCDDRTSQGHSRYEARGYDSNGRETDHLIPATMTSKQLGFKSMRNRPLVFHRAARKESHDIQHQMQVRMINFIYKGLGIQKCFGTSIMF